jgi:nucleolar MIF4G domain-containing protein 1
LGETGVGGAEVLKSLKDDVAGFDVGKISDTRVRNVARAYAWWLAKDACTLMILKVCVLLMLGLVVRRALMHIS